MAKKQSFPKVVYVYDDAGQLIVETDPSDCVVHCEHEPVGVYKLDHVAIAVNTTHLEPVKSAAKSRKR